jgi:hypothetical protein
LLNEFAMADINQATSRKIQTLVQIAAELRQGKDSSITRLSVRDWSDPCIGSDDGGYYRVLGAALLGSKLEEAADGLTFRVVGKSRRPFS